MAILSGSICLSDIPREQMKKIKCKDGVERIYVNVAVIERICQYLCLESFRDRGFNRCGNQ